MKHAYDATNLIHQKILKCVFEQKKCNKSLICDKTKNCDKDKDTIESDNQFL